MMKALSETAIAESNSFDEEDDHDDEESRMVKEVRIGTTEGMMTMLEESESQRARKKKMATKKRMSYKKKKKIWKKQGQEGREIEGAKENNTTIYDRRKRR